MPCCGKSSVSHPIIRWRCPKEIRSQLISRVFSSINPKAILACSLNASMGVRDEEEIGARDEDGGFLTNILEGGAMIDKMNIMGFRFFFLKRWD